MRLLIAALAISLFSAQAFAFSLTGSLDQLQEQLYKEAKSKRARSLKGLYSKLFLSSEADPLSFKEEIAAAEKDILFRDYGFWFHGYAEVFGAKKALLSEKPLDAVKLANSAIQRFLQIEANDPYSALLKQLPKDIGIAEILIGDAHCAQKKCNRALGWYERAFQRLNSVQGALGVLLPETLKNYSSMCAKNPNEICEGWIFRFSNFFSKNSEEMKSILRFFPNVLENNKAARFERQTVSYKAPDLDMVAFESAMDLYKDGKNSGTAGAIEAFKKFGETYPKATYRFRARYWLGEALRQEGKVEEATKVWVSLVREAPTSYYGILSGFPIQVDVATQVDAMIPLGIVIDSQLLPSELIRLKKAEHFLAEGAGELASIELKDFKARDALSSPFLMYLALLHSEAGNHVGAFAVLSELFQRGYERMYSSYVLRMIFPTPYAKLIKKYAEANDLDPLLVLSLVKQESSFDAKAVSSAGAQGLMQIMPSTAVDVVPEVLRSSLTDPETNIRLGTKYLSGLVKRFDGNWALALAGYNAGPNAVDRWLKDGAAKKGLPEFIENIPYRETRDYVASIFRNYFWYSKRIGSPIKDSKVFWPAKP